MKLRIISGKFKGRYLTLPDRRVKFRPTQQRVRQSLVEIVKEKIQGAVAADVCAGAGAFGIELLSRGAQTVHFIEHDKLSGQAIIEHVKKFGIQSQCRIFIEDVRRFIQRNEYSYDIIFYDPPYNDASLAGEVGRLLALVKAGGVLLFEHLQEDVAPHCAAPYGDDYRVETRHYGDTAVDIFFKG
jgi:16S rRNA (guanine(966)-N(2))-methyltransferase RsmD